MESPGDMSETTRLRHVVRHDRQAVPASGWLMTPVAIPRKRHRFPRAQEYCLKKKFRRPLEMQKKL
jgi:hypothetical protein